MPNPGMNDDSGRSELSKLLHDIQREILLERSLAAKRHDDVLARLVDQHEMMQKHSTLYSSPLGLTSTRSELRPSTVTKSELLQTADEFAEEPDFIAKNDKLSAFTKDLSDVSKLSEEHASNTWRDSIKKMVKHPRFEYGFGMLIVTNAFVMCLEAQRRGLEVGCDLQYHGGCGDRQADGYKMWTGTVDLFTVVDWILGIFFTAEVALKLYAFSREFFADFWNDFDLLCVTVFIIEKTLSEIIIVDMHSFSNDEGMAHVVSRMMRLLRLLRLLRLIRLMRMLFSVDALYTMVTALKGMVWVVFWGMMLLFLILTICALFTSILLHSTYFEDHHKATGLSQLELEKQQEMFAYFGTFTRCLLSMFEITLGNWPRAARLIVEEFSSVFIPICLIHKITIGFAVVGVINGCILQETFKVASTDDVIMVRQKKRELQMFASKMNRLFDALDVQDDGELSYQEFHVIVSHPDLKLWLSSLGIDTSDIETMFHLLDSDNDGTVSRKELVSQMPRLGGPSRNIDLRRLCKQVLPNYSV